MISDSDKIALLEIAKKYKVTKLYLFGSNLESEREAHDIDIAVEGLAGSDYFKFYRDLIFNLSKPVDLVDLRNKTLFVDLIKSEGILIYG